jgi:opacity protein-like surface antigen
MKSILMGVLAMAVLVGGAQARDAPAADEATTMRDLFAGTLEIDVPAGDWSAKRYFAPDHTYRETGSDGEVHGAWSIEQGKVCAKADKPALGPDRATRYCNAVLGHHAGERWTDADPVTGNTVFFTLKAGR